MNLCNKFLLKMLKRPFFVQEKSKKRVRMHIFELWILYFE